MDILSKIHDNASAVMHENAVQECPKRRIIIADRDTGKEHDFVWLQELRILHGLDGVEPSHGMPEAASASAKLHLLRSKDLQ